MPRSTLLRTVIAYFAAAFVACGCIVASPNLPPTAAAVRPPSSTAPLAVFSPTPSGTATQSPPATATATASPIPSPTAPPSHTPAATIAPCVPTDQDQYVYNPSRLQVLAPCIRVTGVIAVIRKESDGDWHFQLRLDPEFTHLLTAANANQGGNLVIEPVCALTVTQADAIATCASDPDPFTGPFPTLNQRVWMEGRYVTDSQHGGWAELHPLYRWGPEGGPAVNTNTPGPTRTRIPNTATPRPAVLTNTPAPITATQAAQPTSTQPALAPTQPPPAAWTGYNCGGTPCIKGNISSDGRRLYHFPGCPSYDRTVIDESQGERWFTTEAEAVAAGWVKAGNCP